MKTLKSLSVLTAAVLSNSLSLNAASDAANKPNFVIIFCDDMGIWGFELLWESHDPHTEYRPYGL